MRATLFTSMTSILLLASCGSCGGAVGTSIETATTAEPRGWSVETLEKVSAEDLSIDAEGRAHARFLRLDPVDLPAVFRTTETERDRLSFRDFRVRHGRREGAAWVFEAVGIDAQTGRARFAADAAGRAATLYASSDDDDHSVGYEHRSGDGWRRDEVASGANAVHVPKALVFDAAGDAHAVYLALESRRDASTGIVSENDFALKYARQNGDSWTVETIAVLLRSPLRVRFRECVLESGYGIGLALDSTGRPHVAYRDLSRGTVEHASRDGSSWRTETVRETAGCSATLGFDPSNRPHIAYDDVEGRHLVHASSDGSAWRTSVVDGIAAMLLTSNEMSLAFDASGNPMLAYTTRRKPDDDSSLESALLRDIRLARSNGREWTIDRLDPEGFHFVGSHASLAVDRHGVVHALEARQELAEGEAQAHAFVVYATYR